jgi:cyclohexanone monooxygenase
MTGAITNVDILGEGGHRLRDKWAPGPKAYLGLATAGFPNLFLVTGPGSPSVLSNMLPSIEQHVEWISDCIEYMNENQHVAISVDQDAEEAWAVHVNEVAGTSVYPSCNSWYLGANVEGKTRVFMPYLGVPPYVEKCDQVVAAGYEGFILTGAA